MPIYGMRFCMARSVAALGDWEDVRVFLAVVRGESFSAAARALASDPSTVSRRIASLEASLGRPLFERGPRSVRRTPHAEALVGPALRVEQAVLALEDTARRAEEAPRGKVTIALTEGLAQHVVVPRVLPALLERHPELAVALVTGDRPADLERHEADVALRFFRPPRGELVARRVARLELAVLASKKRVKAFSRIAPPSLPWTSYVLPGVDTPEARAIAALGAVPRVECSSVETQLAAVRAGIGVAIAPRILVEALPDVAALPFEGLGHLDLFVVTRASVREIPRVAVVFDALVDAFRALPSRRGAATGPRARSK